MRPLPVYYNILRCEPNIQEHDLKLNWVSQVSGRQACDDLGIYKRKLAMSWRPVDTECVYSGDQIDRYVPETYQQWFKGRFRNEPADFSYLRFTGEDKSEHFTYATGDDSQETAEFLFKIVQPALRTNHFQSIVVVKPIQKEIV